MEAIRFRVLKSSELYSSITLYYKSLASNSDSLREIGGIIGVCNGTMSREIHRNYDKHDHQTTKITLIHDTLGILQNNV